MEALADACNTISDDLAEMDDSDLDLEDRQAARDSAWETVERIVGLADQIRAKRDRALGTAP